MLIRFYDEFSPFGLFSMIRRLLFANPMALLQFFGCLALLLCLASARERRGPLSPGPFGSDSTEARLANCPFECDCKGLTVDCSNRGLKQVPHNLPSIARRLHLEGNNISVVRRADFLGLSSLKILDLRQNEITEVEDAAFEGAFNLNELILFQNQLKHIRPAMFTGLKNLKALLLNANKITSVRRDAFVGLRNLNLLSLYDNKIQSLANGTFEPLENIQALHLGKNPFACDCHLRWLGAYLKSNPVETSDARCEEPRRVQRRRLSALDLEDFQCKAEPIDCPPNCTCIGSTIKCSGPEPQPVAGRLISGNGGGEFGSVSATTETYLDLNDIAAMPYDSDALYLCHKGRCVPVDDLNFECKCKTGWSGPLCDQGKTAPEKKATCQKKMHRDHYQENGCRSTKRLKQAECVGVCNSGVGTGGTSGSAAASLIDAANSNQCCRPAETKKRPVKMVCPDGSHFTKHIEIVRKCACDKRCG